MGTVVQRPWAERLQWSGGSKGPMGRVHNKALAAHSQVQMSDEAAFSEKPKALTAT